MSNDLPPFAADKDRFRDLAARAAEIAAHHLEKINDQPVDPIMPEEAQRRLLDLELPSEGMSADSVLDLLEEAVMPWPLATGHARSYGWVNSPPAPIGLVADTLASALNATSDGYDHAGVFLQATACRWMMELTGYPLGEPGNRSMGILFSGGSAANLNALTVARHMGAKKAGWDIRREGLQGNRPKLIFYGSSETHSSIQKCVEQLGLGSDNLRSVAVDENYQLRCDDLRAAIEADRKAGHQPCCIVGCAGTTNTGAIDPLNALADIAEEQGLWFHVDGAYGGFAGLDPRYEVRYKGIARADSLTINPHKWLMTPVDCGALLLRDKAKHREAFDLVPAYLAEGGSDEAPWPYEYSFQLTYANRGVKTWANLARLGRQGLTDLVVQMNDIAIYLGERLEAHPDFEIMAPVSLSVVCFRYNPKDRSLSEEALDQLNGQLAEAISLSGEAHMPASKIGERRILRACFLHYENCKEDADHLIELIPRLAARL